MSVTGLIRSKYLVSRVTGHLAYLNFTSPLRAFIRTCRFAGDDAYQKR